MNTKLLSIILLSYYSNERLRECYARLSSILGAEHIDFELIIMDDGSKDNSFEIALDLERNNKNVLAYRLSRNFTSHYSIFAGLSVCNGAVAIPIPDDEQQPYDTLVSMYRLWEKGEKIIIPHRISRDDSARSRLFSELFYQIMNKVSDINFPKGGADTFMIDREVIDIINTKIHPVNTSTISEVLRLGFNPYLLPYERPLGNNKKSRWSFKKKWKLAKDFFFSSSSFPIKSITFIGIIFSVFSFLLMMFYFVVRLFNLDIKGFTKVQGWTSIIIAISFFSGLILLSLGIISEYILRIYDEVKNRPGYIIQKKD